MAEQHETSYKDVYAPFLKTVENVDDQMSDAAEKMAISESTKKVYQANSCLCIGPCTGLTEIYFIRRFMPNLQTLTAVEPDATAGPELVQNVQSHLPNVQLEVQQMTCKEFLQSNDSLGKTYDAVLLFNVLFHLDDEERLTLFKTLHDESLLSRDGSLIVEHLADTGRSDDYLRLVDELRPELPMLLMDTIKREALETGFHAYYTHEHVIVHNYTDPDEDLVKFFGDYVIYRSLSMEEFQLATKKTQKSGKFICTCVFLWLEKS